MDHPQMVVVKTRQAWLDQANDAVARLEELADGRTMLLAEMEKLDHDAFARLIEAMHALEHAGGPKIGEDLIQLARLRPVDEVVLGL